MTNETNTPNALPDKLSELIDVAIQDAKKLDRDKYTPSYIYYYMPEEPYYDNASCYVCDAGAVMVGTLLVDKNSQADPSEFHVSTERKLDALDHARRGAYSMAVEQLGFCLTIRQAQALDKIQRSPWMEYRTWEDFDKHLSHMKRVAGQLRAMGY